MPIPENIETPPGRGRVAIDTGFARRTAIIAFFDWHTISENPTNGNWWDRVGIGGVVLAMKQFEIIIKSKANPAGREAPGSSPEGRVSIG